MTNQIYLLDFTTLETNIPVYLHSDVTPSGTPPVFRLLADGNYTFQLRPNEPLVTEVYKLSKTGTQATLREYQYKLEKKLERAKDYYNDRYNSIPGWLVYNLEGEGKKYSLVSDYALDVLTEGLANPTFAHGKGRWRLAITRTNFFETPYLDESNTAIVASKANVSASGGKWYTATDFTTYGDVDGRMAQFKVNYSVNQLARLYVGIRPIRANTWAYGNYNGWVECELGTMGADSSVTTDAGATASGGASNNTVVTTFATQTAMIGRLAIPVSVFAADPTIYVGSYKVLLRARLNEAGEVGLRMQVRYGSATNASAQWQSYQYFSYSHANYTLVEMGEMTLPPHPHSPVAVGLDLADFHIVFQAERVSGASTLRLYWDAIALIPAEHYARIDIKDPTTVPTTSSLRLYTDENGKSWAVIVNDSDSKITQSIEPELTNWTYPKQQGAIVLAALEGTDRVHSLNRDCDIAVVIAPRYRGYKFV